MAGPDTSAAVPAGADRRPAGSDAERRAANAFAAQAHEAGLTATVTSFSIWPRGGVPQALLVIAAIAGGLVASSAAAPGAAVVAAAAVLFVLDATGSAQPVRHLLGRRASQNLDIETADDGEARPGTVIITASLDTPRSRGAMRIATNLLKDPYLAATLAMALLLICCALRVAGLDAGALTAVQFVPTVVLILLVPAFLDTAIATPTADETPGAAGVALALMDDLSLDHFQPRVLLTGATAASASGMRRWLRANRFPRETTAVVSLRTTPGGSLAFSTREGAVLTQRSHRDLLRLAREVAEDLGGVIETTNREITNESRAARRLPAIGIEAGAEAPDQLRGFARELIERLDADLGPSLGG